MSIFKDIERNELTLSLAVGVPHIHETRRQSSNNVNNSQTMPSQCLPSQDVAVCRRQRTRTETTVVVAVVTASAVVSVCWLAPGVAVSSWRCPPPPPPDSWAASTGIAVTQSPQNDNCLCAHEK